MVIQQCDEGINIYDSVTASDLLIHDNDKGIYCDYGYAELSHARIFSNSEGLIGYYGEYAIDSCTINNNGTGAYLDYGSLQADTCEIYENGLGIGGSIGYGTCLITCNNCTFSDNTVSLLGDISLYDCDITGGPVSYTHLRAHET